MRDFQRLDFWQRSHKLTLQIYLITKGFPKEELFGLTSQMRRSSASIATNIAEGCGRRTILELKRFLDIATGSTSELQYQLLLSCELGYLSKDVSKELTYEAVGIRKMIYSFTERLQADSR